MKCIVIIMCIYSALALDKEWWKHSVMYEIYIPSFKDSNGDGWGDLKGIISKLDYLKDFGVDTVYVGPYHPSPMLDTGYDVSNYMAINPLYGTMADFNELIRQLKNRNMKLIMDLVINHSSDQHKWFAKSVQRIAPYTDYYVWKDPKGYNASGHPIEPNNWCSTFMRSAWTWSEKRKQFYYHAFLPEQPDLNHRNARVVREMKKIIKFWLNKGVAGLRFDAVHVIMEDQSFKDEEPVDPADRGKEVACYKLKTEKIFKTNDTLEYIRELRPYIDQISAKANTLERLVILELFGDKEVMASFYGNKTHPIAHYPFNYHFEWQFDYLNQSGIDFIINYWMEITPNTTVTNWMLGCHDRFRSSFKFIQEYVNVMLMLITLLPGVTVLYYGEEIGMTSGVIRPHQRRLFSEYARTPMQWDASLNAGFSSNVTTWLPTNPNYWKLNVMSQMSDQSSIYNYLKSLLALKKSDAIKYGSFEKVVLKDWVYVLQRSYKNDGYYVVVLSVSTEKEIISLDAKIPNLPSVLEVYLASPNAKFKKGSVLVNKKNRTFMMKPMSAVVLRKAAFNNLRISDEAKKTPANYAPSISISYKKKVLYLIIVIFLSHLGLKI